MVTADAGRGGVWTAVRSLAALLALGVLTQGACTKATSKAEEPVKAEPKAADAPPAEAPAAPPPTPETCHVVTKLTGELPVYLPGKGVVVTRLMKPCVTRDGQRGFEQDTPWLAMGFPCTGGSGRIEIKGTHYHNPKMVTFILGTDCPMSPQDKGTVDKLVRESLDLPPGAKLMAITPFVLQYWEIPGMTDADTGFQVDLRSAAALEGAWKRVRENEPLHVKLYGRENAWVQGGHFYAVDADLRLTGRHAFQVQVTGVKSLSEEELQELKGRCEALRPKRNCTDVF